MQNNLEFRGKWSDLFSTTLFILLFTIITAGLYLPWGYARLRRTILNQTFYQGRPLQFDGTGEQAVIHFLVILFFSAITFGFYVYLGFAQTRLLKWDTQHTLLPDGRRLEYRGVALDLFAQFLLIVLLSIITLGLYYPWGYARLRRYIISNTYIQGGQALQFSGTGAQFLVISFVNGLLTLITFGLYAFFGFAAVRLLKWDTANTVLQQAQPIGVQAAQPAVA